MGKVPLNLGAPVAIRTLLDQNGSNLLEATRRAVDTALPRPESTWSTIYNRNSIEIQVPCHASLPASKTVEDITNSCIRSKKRANRDDKPNHPEGKSLHKLFIAILADGSPVDLFLRLKLLCNQLVLKTTVV
jgi:hypothetical protein